GIPDDDVRVRARRDRALPRIEPERPRVRSRDELDEAVRRDPAGRDAERPEHVQPVLDSRPAVRHLLELLARMPLLLRPLERAVVGRDRRDDVALQRMPEVLLVRLRAGWRRVDVFRALEPGLVERRLVDEQVLGAGLTPHLPALLARERD